MITDAVLLNFFFHPWTKIWLTVRNCVLQADSYTSTSIFQTRSSDFLKGTIRYNDIDYCKHFELDEKMKIKDDIGRKFYIRSSTTISRLNFRFFVLQFLIFLNEKKKNLSISSSIIISFKSFIWKKIVNFFRLFKLNVFRKIAVKVPDARGYSMRFLQKRNVFIRFYLI